MIYRYKPPPRPRWAQGKPLIRITYIPDKMAYLTVAGPDQSEIRWAESGKSEIICNEFIKRENIS